MAPWDVQTEGTAAHAESRPDGFQKRKEASAAGWNVQGAGVSRGKGARFQGPGGLGSTLCVRGAAGAAVRSYLA